MRVLQIMAGKGNGGAELYSTDVMLSLHQAGIDQSVVMRPSAPRIRELQQAGLRLASDVLKTPLRPLQRARLRALIAAEKPDIIHCWMRRAASLIPASAAKTAAIIGWFGDYEDIRHFKTCDYFAGCTQDLTRHMRESGIAPARAAYIPTFPSVDDAPAIDRAQIGTPPGARILLTLSRLHPTKGLDTMIEALASLPNCHLWIAGDGPIRGDLERLASKCGVAARVKFLGWRTDRGALLRAADICVLPSRYEPFGTVILDAWSTGTALVACESDGPRAHIRNRVNGMLAPPDNPAALAQAIKAVITDEPLRTRIAAAGRAEFLAHFTRERVTDQWIAYYQNVIADHAKR
jgi:hypothetical protein